MNYPHIIYILHHIKQTVPMNTFRMSQNLKRTSINLPHISSSILYQTDSISEPSTNTFNSPSQIKWTVPIYQSTIHKFYPPSNIKRTVPIPIHHHPSSHHQSLYRSISNQSIPMALSIRRYIIHAGPQHNVSHYPLQHRLIDTRYCVPLTPIAVLMSNLLGLVNSILTKQEVLHSINISIVYTSLA